MSQQETSRSTLSAFDTIIPHFELLEIGRIDLAGSWRRGIVSAQPFEREAICSSNYLRNDAEPSKSIFEFGP
jgi:hypothetical protein